MSKQIPDPDELRSISSRLGFSLASEEAKIYREALSMIVAARGSRRSMAGSVVDVG